MVSTVFPISKAMKSFEFLVALWTTPYYKSWSKENVLFEFRVVLLEVYEEVDSLIIRATIPKLIFDSIIWMRKLESCKKGDSVNILAF